MGETRTRAGSPPKPRSRGRPSVRTVTSTWSRLRLRRERAFSVASPTVLPSASTSSTGVPPAALATISGRRRFSICAPVGRTAARSPHLRAARSVGRFFFVDAEIAFCRLALGVSLLEHARQYRLLVQAEQAAPVDRPAPNVDILHEQLDQVGQDVV